MAYYIYLLRCGDGSLYSGITTDPARRREEHRSGTGAKYTRAHKAVYIERIWACADRSNASKLEYALKRLNKAQKENLALGRPLSETGIAFDGIACGGKDYPDRLRAALTYCKKDPLITIDITEAIGLGLARVIAAEEKGVLVYLPAPSKAYYLCTDDVDTAERLCDLITEEKEMIVTHRAHEQSVIKARFVTESFEPCYNVAYLKKVPPISPVAEIVVRPMDQVDLPTALSVYTLYQAEEEMIELIQRKKLLGAYAGEKLVGFVGFHAEGAMGMLEVLPEYRKKGYGTALVCAQIDSVLQEKHVPFGQIFASNLPSLEMQKKLGFSFSEPTVVWNHIVR